MTPIDTQSPFSQAEAEQLDALLNAKWLPKTAMNISMLDGYFAAIVSGPNTILPSRWIPFVWDFVQGVKSPAFGSNEQVQVLMNLIMRFMNDTVQVLTNSPKDYDPIFMESVDQSDAPPIMDHWCAGYVAGMKLDLNAWKPLLDAQPHWFYAIQLFGVDDPALDAARDAVSPKETLEISTAIPQFVRNIFAHWMVKRLDDRKTGLMQSVSGQARQPVRSEPKIGRNDICHCGSGKKFKHCHGGVGFMPSGTTLH
jgi:uncharacterized protein